MGKLNEIRDKLRSGCTTGQLIGQGYSRSSVYRENKKLKYKDAQLGTPIPPMTDEIQELRRQKEVIKLQKEIVELQAAKENLPERVAALEKTIVELRHQTIDAVDSAVFVCLKYAGMDREEAKEFANGWTEKIIQAEK